MSVNASWDAWPGSAQPRKARSSFFAAIFVSRPAQLVTSETEQGGRTGGGHDTRQQESGFIFRKHGNHLRLTNCALGLHGVLWSAIAKYLGPAGLGKIQLAYLLAVVVALLTSMGLPVSNAYLIGRGLFSTSAILWQNLLESIVASAISVCVILIMQSTLRRIVPIAPELLLVTLMWISLQTLVSNLSSVLLADRRFRGQSSANFFQGAVSLAFVLVALKFMAAGVRGVAFALVLATFVGVIYLLMLFRVELREI